MSLPSNVGTGTVVGRFLDFVGLPIVGTVTFTPSPEKLENITADPSPVTILPKPVVVTLDASGALSRALVATDDADNNPVNWTYMVTFNFAGTPLTAFPITVPQGTTVDLAVVAPAAASNGVSTATSIGIAEDGTPYLIGGSSERLVTEAAQAAYAAPRVPEWLPNHAYLANELVTHVGTLYQRTTTGTSGSSWTGTNWSSIGGGGVLVTDNGDGTSTVTVSPGSSFVLTDHGDGTASISLAGTSITVGDGTNATAAGIDAQAKADAAQAFAIQRANHTGTQDAATISGLFAEFYRNAGIATMTRREASTVVSGFASGVQMAGLSLCRTAATYTKARIYLSATGTSVTGFKLFVASANGSTILSETATAHASLTTGWNTLTLGTSLTLAVGDQRYLGLAYTGGTSPATRGWTNSPAAFWPQVAGEGVLMYRGRGGGTGWTGGTDPVLGSLVPSDGGGGLPLIELVP